MRGFNSNNVRDRRTRGDRSIRNFWTLLYIQMKPFSKKTKQELILELNTEFNGNVAKMADNYSRTIDELLSVIK